MKGPIILLLIALVGCAPVSNRSEIRLSHTDSLSVGESNLDVEELLAIEISEDDIINRIYVDDLPDSVYAFEVTTDTYINTKGGCSKGALIKITRLTQNQELFFDIVWASLINGDTVLSTPKSFDITPMQGDASADLNFNYKLSNQCNILAVEEYYEGGDIDLTRTSKITFIAIDEGGNLATILEVQLEDTRISEYYASVNENESGTSAIAELEVLPTMTNGFYDLKVIFNSNNDELERTEEVFRFIDGRYTEQY